MRWFRIGKKLKIRLRQDKIMKTLLFLYAQIWEGRGEVRKWYSHTWDNKMDRSRRYGLGNDSRHGSSERGDNDLARKIYMGLVQRNRFRISSWLSTIPVLYKWLIAYSSFKLNLFLRKSHRSLQFRLVHGDLLVLLYNSWGLTLFH